MQNKTLRKAVLKDNLYSSWIVFIVVCTLRLYKGATAMCVTSSCCWGPVIFWLSKNVEAITNRRLQDPAHRYGFNVNRFVPLFPITSAERCCAWTTLHIKKVIVRNVSKISCYIQPACAWAHDSAHTAQLDPRGGKSPAQPQERAWGTGLLSSSPSQAPPAAAQATATRVHALLPQWMLKCLTPKTWSSWGFLLPEGWWGSQRPSKGKSGAPYLLPFLPSGVATGCI